MKITNFYNTEYLQSALYQSFRSIGNYIDGLKPSSRKIVYTIDKNNITTKIKASQLCSKVAEQTQYLHGEESLSGVLVGLARDYIGGNNLNILTPDGNFGSRFIQSPSAARYIYTYKSPNFHKIFDQRDNSILDEQYFEGEKIEYRYYVPILPLILVNGSEGIGNGFAQKILPRNIQDIKAEIQAKLKSSKYEIKPLIPYFEGFRGTVRANGESHKWIVEGTFERIGKTKIHITEVPIGYDLKQYLKVLDDLVENKVIKDYDDNSNNDTFDFTCRVSFAFSGKQDSDIIEQLKLRKVYSENYTCTDEKNAIIEFKSDAELLEQFINVRTKFYGKRKKHLIKLTEGKISVAENKVRFITDIINDQGIVSNKSRKEIDKYLVDNAYDKIDSSYDYLLRMPIYSLTKEKITALKKELVVLKKDLIIIEKKTSKTMWLDDLK